MSASDPEPPSIYLTKLSNLALDTTGGDLSISVSNSDVLVIEARLRYEKDSSVPAGISVPGGGVHATDDCGTVLPSDKDSGTALCHCATVINRRMNAVRNSGDDDIART